MKASEFKSKLTQKLQELDFVLFIDLEETESYVDGQVFLKWEMKLNVFYHQKSLKLNFALIQNKARIWAIDHHRPFGWHRHPLNNTATHEAIDPMEIEAIVVELNEVIHQVQQG